MSTRSVKSSSSSRGRPRVEITVKSLEGIVLLDCDDIDKSEDLYLPNVWATVGFSGSASDMQVGSSCVCPHSGQLLIESTSLQLDRSKPCDDPSRCMLSGNWREERTRNSHTPQPHVVVVMPDRDPKLPMARLSSMNRGSRIVKEIPEVDHSDTQSTISTSSISTLGRNSLEPPTPASRTGSAVWTQDGAELPEIVELTVRLKSYDDSVSDQKGIAYLVLYGHKDDEGSYLMQLPVQTPNHDDSSRHSSSRARIRLTSDARLTLKIKVFPGTKSPSVTSPSCSTHSSSSTETKTIEYSRSMLEGQIKPLMQQIMENEKAALRHAQAQKRAIDVTVPLQGNQHYPENSTFCDAMWSWNRVFRTLSSAVRQCDTGTTAGVAMPGSSSSVCSTIATRDSLNI